MDETKEEPPSIKPQEWLDVTSSSFQKDEYTPFLPVLIIPGFMSSGLQVVKSTHNKEWEGKRIWINLASLGFQAMYMNRKSDVVKQDVSSTRGDEEEGNEHDDNDENMDDERGVVLRNMWLQHMALQEDMISERNGVNVQNISGLVGVDYLTPGALTNHVSYVFGPVIRALEKVNYQEGINLEAAPYDWRLAPSSLEERDEYFTRTMNQIQDLCARNNNTPVVLLCHSLGCKMGHYLLNFAQRARGREWIDRHIHTYMPVGGPHLGAPKVLRSLVTGDKMGLEAFLSDTEALIFGRSLGSGLFLLPEKLPQDAPSNAFVRRDGALEISIVGPIDTNVFLNNRQANHRPNKLKFTVIFEKKGASTPFAYIQNDESVSFGETITFRTNNDGPQPDSTLTLLLCEPGLSTARKSMTAFNRGHQVCFDRFFGVWRCDCCGEDTGWAWPNKERPFLCFLNILFFWWLIWPIIRYTFEFTFKIYFGVVYGTFWCLCRGTVLTADELAMVSGGTSVLAKGRVKRLRSSLVENGHVNLDVELVSDRDRKRLCSCCRDNRSTNMTVRIKWISPESTVLQNPLCSPVCEQPSNGRSVERFESKKTQLQFTPRSGSDILSSAGLSSMLHSVKDIYDSDPLDPRALSSASPPPVRLVKAVYGVNLATEVGAVYKRQPTEVTCEEKPQILFALDKNVRLQCPDGYLLDNGVLCETSKVKQLVKTPPDVSKQEYVYSSGDGTVPYWSLQHVRTWENDCQVSIDELDGAPHREILADKRLHQIIISHVCRKKSDDAGDVV